MEVNLNISPAQSRPLREAILRSASSGEPSSPLLLNDEMVAGNPVEPGDIIQRPVSSRPSRESYAALTAIPEAVASSLASGPAAPAVITQLRTLEEKQVQFFQKRIFRIPGFMDTHVKIRPEQAAAILEHGSEAKKECLMAGESLWKKAPLSSGDDLAAMMAFRGNGDVNSLAHADLARFLKQKGDEGCSFAFKDGKPLDTYGAYRYLSNPPEGYDGEKNPVVLFNEGGLLFLTLKPLNINDFSLDAIQAYCALLRSRVSKGKAEEVLDRLTPPVRSESIAERSELFKRFFTWRFNIIEAVVSSPDYLPPCDSFQQGSTGRRSEEDGAVDLALEEYSAFTAGLDEMEEIPAGLKRYDTLYGWLEALFEGRKPEIKRELAAPLAMDTFTWIAAEKKKGSFGTATADEVAILLGIELLMDTTLDQAKKSVLSHFVRTPEKELIDEDDTLTIDDVKLKKKAVS